MSYYKKQFEILYKYLKKIEKNRPPFQEYIQIMSDLCRELMHVEDCIFWLYDEEKGVISSQISTDIERCEIKAFDGIIGHVIKTGERRLVNDSSKDPYYNPALESITGIKNQSSIYVPLKHSNNEVYGAIQVTNRQDGLLFNDEDLEMMNFISLYCEEALTSFFFEEELLETQNDIVYLLAELGESRSGDTGMHVRRVSLMAELLARLAGLNERHVQMIKLASPLHDLGKVGIKDAVLNKPGRLSDEEYSIMKNHTNIGHNILSPMKRKLLRAADIICHQHHERFDGMGYPCGLKGEDIHIYARITSVCDVFDALANKRAYKPAWERADIIAEFQKQSGAQFDPALTEIFLAHIDEFYQILENFADQQSE